MRYTAYNGRFYESGGVSPLKHLCKFASASPARTFVNPRLHKAARTLDASGRQHGTRRKLTEKSSIFASLINKIKNG